MTSEGILARGKANYEAKKFLDNSETLAYIETLPKEKPKEEKPKKEAKKDASDKR
ncbi:hypothetical protein ACFL1X_12490 [Candidatus Hydrogenedentota bacterium]